MKRLLSTRILSEAQKDLLPKAHFFEEYDAIEIELFPPAERDTGDRLALFTSQNAVHSCFQSGSDSVFHSPGCCCVGKKTAALLRGFGQEILEVADRAADLAEILIKKYNDRSFVHYCGNLRLDVLATALADAGIPMEEEIVYETVHKERTFEEPFDAVLFYSPSGVESFIKNNTLAGTTAVCIGPTTAAEASKYTNRIIRAGTPTVEQVILAAQSALL